MLRPVNPYTNCDLQFLWKPRNANHHEYKRAGVLGAGLPERLQNATQQEDQGLQRRVAHAWLVLGVYPLGAR